MNSREKLFLAGFLMLFASCTVGPNYKKPVVTVPSQYRGASTEQQTASFADQKWWDAFQDEVLRDLIHTALQQNYDLRIAATRILEAQALLGITRADQFPTVIANGSAGRDRLPETPASPPVEISTFHVSSSLNWELDFWGKFRRATESARASLLAQEWAQRQIVSTLVSDVASSYFELRELDLELEISRQTLASREDSLRLTKILEEHGATSLLDVRQAEQLVFTASASIAALEDRIQEQENFISILIGQNPQSIPRGRKLIDQPHALEVPAGLPSTLLERRPDIEQAEQELIAANAQIGVAKAQYFPQISLTAAGGFQSSALSNLFSGPAGLWSLAASLVQPVFEGGRIRNRVKFSEARTQEATLLYQQTVQQAFRDVSDSLIRYQKSQEVRAQLEQLTISAQDATRLSNMRYQGGRASYLEVLDSDTRYFTAQLSLAQAQLAELQALVQIYRSLGGGWQ